MYGIVTFNRKRDAKAKLAAAGEASVTAEETSDLSARDAAADSETDAQASDTEEKE